MHVDLKGIFGRDVLSLHTTIVSCIEIIPAQCQRQWTCIKFLLLEITGEIAKGSTPGENVLLFTTCILSISDAPIIRSVIGIRLIMRFLGGIGIGKFYR